MMLVSYLRVSTAGQEASGLGLDDQRHEVARYAARVGGTIAKEYVETETAKKPTLANRPELRKAIAHARMVRGRVLIAKLDRLSRNVHFLSGLQEAGVAFTACDIPDADETTIHIYAAIAQREAKLISMRTKASLDAYRRGGYLPKRLRKLYPSGVPADVAAQWAPRAGKLGTHLPECRHNLKAEAAAAGRALGAAAVRAQADAAYAELIGPRCVELAGQGLGARAIARALNADGFETRKGKPWNPTQVRRVLKRAGG
jgi:DNA invertase Pin-like site-specific DNA recombinase